MTRLNPNRPGGLRTGHLIVLLVATHTPLTLLWGAVPQAYAIGQVDSLPLVFGLAGLVMLGFVLGSSGLGKRVRHPGGIYVQVVHGLGRPVGLGAAAVLVVAYIGLVANMYGYFALVFAALWQSLTGTTVPLWLAVVLCVTVAGLLSRVPARRIVPVLAVIILGQLVGVAACVIAAFRMPATGHVSFESVQPGGLLTGFFGVALVFALTAFIGTEVGASYSEELIDPEHSLLRASYLSYVITTAVLVLGAVALSVVAGPENISLLAARSGAALIPLLIPKVVGAGPATAATQLMLSVLVLGILGAALALQNAIKRQLSGLARDGVLPGRGVDPAGPDRLFLRAAQPVVAGAIAVVGTQTKAHQLPLWLQVGCALAVLGVLTLASAATVVWFLRGEADEAGFFGWEGQVVAAAFSAVTLGVVFSYGITHVLQLAPASAGSANWLANLLVFGPFVVGVIGAWYLAASRPSVYAAIGHTQREPVRTVARPSASAVSGSEPVVPR